MIIFYHFHQLKGALLGKACVCKAPHSTILELLAWFEHLKENSVCVCEFGFFPLKK